MEKRQTKQILRNIREEITRNQQVVQSLVLYHDSVATNVNSALMNDSIANHLINKTGFKLFLLAPKGIIQQNITSTSWEIARNSNITLRTDFKTSVLLTELYEQQNIVDEAVGVLISIYESREIHKKENLPETLILLRNSFDELKGREYSLLFYYKQALEELEAD